jgi:AGCS family alanine or glycine:cation symporter
MIQLDVVLEFSDALIFVMALPNILALYILAPVIKRELKSYQSRLTSGEIKSFRD